MNERMNERMHIRRNHVVRRWNARDSGRHEQSQINTPKQKREGARRRRRPVRVRARSWWRTLFFGLVVDKTAGVHALLVESLTSERGRGASGEREAFSFSPPETNTSRETCRTGTTQRSPSWSTVHCACAFHIDQYSGDDDDDDGGGGNHYNDNRRATTAASSSTARSITRRSTTKHAKGTRSQRKKQREQKPLLSRRQSHAHAYTHTNTQRREGKGTNEGEQLTETVRQSNVRLCATKHIEPKTGSLLLPLSYYRTTST